MSAVLKTSRAYIRMMGETDLDSVVEIEQVAYTFPWKRELFRECLFSGYDCHVLEYDGVVVAYSIALVEPTTRPRTTHLMNLCVKPSYQNSGLGAQLLDELITYQSDYRRVKQIYLEVRVSNFQAINLYLKAGFYKIGFARNYYSTKDRGREDALVMIHMMRADYNGDDEYLGRIHPNP